MADRWSTTERQLAFLDQLERRRHAVDQAMWQAPALTIAAQAFLLRVLTDTTVETAVRLWILIAGIAASTAAVLSLLRLREREVRYSEAIATYLEKHGVPDPRPDALERKALQGRGPAGWIDRQLRRLVGGDWWPPVYWFWVAALLLFIVADAVAYAHK